MSARIAISTDTATSAYALLSSSVLNAQSLLLRAKNDEDKRFWSEALASYQSARDELAQQLFPLSHGKAA